MTEASFKITKASKPVGNFSTIALSLFLILLTFFIFLTSISQNNKAKSEKVLQNLRYEFKGKDVQTKIKLWDNDNLAGAGRIFGFKEQIEKVLKLKRIQDTNVIQSGNIIDFNLRFSRVFSEDRQQIKTSGVEILKEILNSLQKNHSLIRRVEVTFPLFARRQEASVEYAGYFSSTAEYYSPEVRYDYAFIPLKSGEQNKEIKIRIILKG